jgi:hypothetical protein
MSCSPIRPRLLGLSDSARYLGNVSPWVVRKLMDTGVISRVRLTLPGEVDIRRLLFDVRDLDALIEKAKA